MTHPDTLWRDEAVRTEVRRIVSDDDYDTWIATHADDPDFVSMLVLLTHNAPHPTPACLVDAWKAHREDPDTRRRLLSAAISEPSGHRPLLLALLDLEDESIQRTLRNNLDKDLFAWCLDHWPTDLGQWILDRFEVPKDERYTAMCQVIPEHLAVLHGRRPKDVDKVLKKYAKARDNDRRRVAVLGWIACHGKDAFTEERIAKERNLFSELAYRKALESLEASNTPPIDADLWRSLGSIAGNAPAVFEADARSRLEARGYRFTQNAKVRGPVTIQCPAWKRSIQGGHIVLVLRTWAGLTSFVDADFPPTDTAVEALRDDLLAVFHAT